MERLKKRTQKLKNRTTHDPAISLPGMYQTKMKTLIWKETYTSMHTAALFIIAKISKQPKCPSTEEQIKMCLFTYIWTHTYIMDIYKYI